MSHVYDEEYQRIIKITADSLGIDIKEGVYLQTSGPNYETPAEVNMYRNLGADAVGMSTAVEALFANALGIRVAGISCLTNMAAGISSEPLSHEEVQRMADKAAESFELLVKNVIIAMSRQDKQTG